MCPFRNFSITRQAHLFAGFLIVTGFALSDWHSHFLILPKLAAFGLLLHASTGFCPAEKVLAKLPWNKT